MKRSPGTTIDNIVLKSELNQFTCSELQAFLRAKELSPKGLKAELVSRAFGCIVEEKVKALMKLPNISQCGKRKRLTGQGLHDAIYSFHTKDPRELSLEELKIVVETIGGASFIDMKGATADAITTVTTFHQPWSDFVGEHQELLQILDPQYILFNFGEIGAAIPPNGPPAWGAAVAAMPLPLVAFGFVPTITVPGPAVIPPGGVLCEYFYVVSAPAPAAPAPAAPAPAPGPGPAAVVEAARQFAGYMQGRFPGLRFWDIRLNAPPVYW